jgi:hypothetical protein
VAQNVGRRVEDSKRGGHPPPPDDPAQPTYLAENTAMDTHSLLLREHGWYRLHSRRQYEWSAQTRASRPHWLEALGIGFSWAGRRALDGLVLHKEQIEDGSKADWPGKGFAVVEIPWVVVSVSFRSQASPNYLHVTQLEIATLASFILTIGTYLANW